MTGQEQLALGLTLVAGAYTARHLWRAWGKLMDKGCAKGPCACSPQELLGEMPRSSPPPTGSAGDPHGADFSQERP